MADVILTSNSKVYDDGELWSFIRRCMAQGKDIHLDHAERTYEEYSARLDVAALERLPELQAYIVRAVVTARGSNETPPASNEKQLIDAVQALCNRMPHGEALNHFHAKREVIELRKALDRATHETREQYPCACPEGSCGRLMKYPNQYCRSQKAKVGDSFPEKRDV